MRPFTPSFIAFIYPTNKGKHTLLPIADRARRRLLTYAVMICTASILLTPVAARSSFELAVERTAFNQRFSIPRIPGKWSSQPVPISHDPFVPDEFSAASRSGGVVGMHVVQGQATGFTVASVSKIRAIVTGSSPHALVDENGKAEVVSLGDVIDGSPIILISPTEVVLKNGRVLDLVQEERK